MSVHTTTSVIDYVGNGTQTAFPYPYPFIDPLHLVVTVDGVVQTLGANYTVTPTTGGTSGTVRFLVPPASGAEVKLARYTPRTQLVDFVQQGPFDPKALEKMGDKLTLITQEIEAGAGGGGGGCACPEADPGTPDIVVEDEYGDPVEIIPGGGGHPGLITEEQLRYVYAHIVWNSVRHEIGEVIGLQRALDGKLPVGALQPVYDQLQQVGEDLDGKSPVDHTHTFAEIQSKPTTVADAGLTDAVTVPALNAALAEKAPLDSPALTGTPRLDGYPLLSTYSSLDWARVVNRPDSLAGYGIGDTYTKTEVDQKISQGGGGVDQDARNRLNALDKRIVGLYRPIPNGNAELVTGGTDSQGVFVLPELVERQDGIGNNVWLLTGIPHDAAVIVMPEAAYAIAYTTIERVMDGILLRWKKPDSTDVEGIPPSFSLLLELP